MFSTLAHKILYAAIAIQRGIIGALSGSRVLMLISKGCHFISGADALRRQSP
jgi:hypothetical protein